MGNRKKRGHGHERRAEILDVAERLFSEFGYAAVTTRMIATEVGISQPAIFRYFENRDELELALCIRSLDELKQRFEQAESCNEDFDQRLRSMLQAFISFAVERPNAYRIVFMTERAPGDEFFEQTNGEVIRQGMQIFAAFRNCVSLSFDQQNEEALELRTQSLWAAIHGLASLLISKPYFPWANHDQLEEHYIAMLTSAQTT